MTRLKCLRFWWARQKNKGLNNSEILKKCKKNWITYFQGRPQYKFPFEWNYRNAKNEIKKGVWD